MKTSALLGTLTHVLATDGDIEVELYSPTYDGDGPITWTEVFRGKLLLGIGEKPEFDHRPLYVINQGRIDRELAAYAERNRNLRGWLP